MSSRFLLHYNSPAESFNAALPLGNGRLGAMFYGGVASERIHLNEDTLWSGVGPAEIPPEGRAALPEIRRLLFAGEHRAAHELAIRTLPGAFTEAYQPVGDLLLDLVTPDAAASAYHRSLDLATATGITRFTVNGVAHERELFVSHPSQVVALRWSVNQPGALSVRLRLASPLRHRISVSPDGLALSGRAPSRVEWFRVKPGEGIDYGPVRGRYGMAFDVRLVVEAPGARITAEPDALLIENATELRVLLDARTSFHHPDSDAVAAATVNRARLRPWADLQNEHRADHSGLFDRVSLHLPAPPDDAAALPIDLRLARRSSGLRDTGLDALLFDYGRYLLIASSRPGSQPANLQGIWNRDMQPPWWSNFTININTEMNYWPAEVCGLPELHTPLFDFIDRLRIHGAVTAHELYGCGGWVAHHQTDLWAGATPGGFTAGTPNEGASRYALWPMGGVWLTRHLWEHYAHGGDLAFLRERAWPALRGAADFILDFLVKRPDGLLTTAPSTSPENSFRLADGFRAAIATGSTMDLSLIRDLFGHCLSASAALGSPDPAFDTRLRDTLKLLPPLVPTASGRVPEWDADYEEWEPHHRHVSHLYGLHPGNEIELVRTPALAAAARRTLDARTDASTGWSLAWKLNFWARLGDSRRAYGLVDLLFHLVDPAITTVAEAGGLYPNLLCAHPPFQIDGNFGYTAGVTELLLQSHYHTGDESIVLELLPALPSAWPSGSITGLRARGGFIVDLHWQDERLLSARIHSTRGTEFRLVYERTVVPPRLAAGENWTFTP